MKSFTDSVTDDADGKKIFQGVKLTYYDNAVDSVENLKSALCSLIKNGMHERLEDDSGDLISKAAMILNTTFDNALDWDEE